MKNSYISNSENNDKYKVKRIHIFAFLSLLITSLVFFECLNRYFIRHLSQNFTILDAFDDQKEDVEILLLGDSHFMFAIDAPQLNNKTFNLSFPAANYIQSYYLLKQQIDKMPRLKMIVMPLSLHSFSAFRTDIINDPEFWNNFIDYGDLIAVKGLKIIKYRTALSITSQSSGRASFIKNLFNFVWRYQCNIKQMASNIKTKNYGRLDKVKAVRRAQSQFQNHNAFDEDLWCYFKKILILCREKNIAVVTLCTPVSKPYFIEAQKYISSEIIRKSIHQDPMSRNLMYKELSYSREYLDRDDLFIADGDHLNGKGKILFTKCLSLDINKIIHTLPRHLSGEKQGHINYVITKK